VNAKAAAPAAEEGGTPLLLPLATLPGVTNNKFAFRACFTDTWQAYAMADYVFEVLELRSMVSVTNLGDHYSVGLSRDFEARFSKLGGEIIGRSYYRTLIDESTRVLEYISATTPDLVYIPCYDQDAISFLQAAEGVLSSLTIVGSDGWDTRDFRETEIPLGSACRLLISNHFNLSAEGPARKSEKLGPKPGQATALTYDALQIAVKAVGLSKTGAPIEVMGALSTLDNFSGVTGIFNYAGGNNGDPLKPVFIQEIRRGAAGLPEFVDLESRIMDKG
jgi:branched-chain amino acid transport system substrate-binding protein